MVKKATKDKEILRDTPSRIGSVEVRSKPLEASSTGHIESSTLSAAAEALSSSVQARVAASPVQGVGSLIESLVGYLGENESEQAEMREFLEMLVDTDPVLKDELLQSLNNTRK
jgi:hypothetical protein